LNLCIKPLTETRDFLVAPLQGVDVILGMPWRHDYNPTIDYDTHRICLRKDNEDISIQCLIKGEMSPLLSHTQAKRAFRKKEKTYMVWVNQLSAEANTSKSPDLDPYISKFSDCFMEDLPPGLPKSRPEDHSIDLLPGQSPPCKAPYRVNSLEQKEIQKQI
ncbi:hypothetical protein, partial [Escherichia coli]|uniref:hypothetical protein n=1 Tax=Escherichia coli TaxID=562 RepID=UPI002577ED6A